MLAAFLYAQFEIRNQIQRMRRQIWTYYAEDLHGWAEAHGVRLPLVPLHCEQAYHMFSYVMPSLTAPGIDWPTPSARHLQRLPLPAPTPFGNGAAIWRQTGRLPSNRGCQRSVITLAIL